MRILLDTNILLDYCDANRTPFHADSVNLLIACVTCNVEVCACAGSLKDVYYILTKRYGEPFGRQSVATLLDLFPIQPLLVSYLHSALHFDEPDFEDGLIRAVAQARNMDAIITRDARAFANSSVPAYAPLDFLSVLNK